MIAEVDLKPGNAVAVFLGIQKSYKPGVSDIPLYNLTRQVGDHPVGATVSAATLARLGYSAPLEMQKWVGGAS